MNMFDFAMGIETEGLTLYQTMARNTPIRELAGIFDFFAREEMRHYEIFKAWEKNITAPPVEETGLVQKTAEVFKGLSRGFETAGIPAIDHEDAYKKALSLEEKSIAYYNELMAQIAGEEQKLVIELIVRQERAHKRLINQMMEFQRHPHEWLENAEWNHHEEEY